MSHPDEELDDAIAELWEQWRDEMMRRVDVVGDAVEALGDGELADDQRLEAASAAHKIAGTAGSFGFSAASHHAREIEKALERDDSSADAAALVERVHAIRAEFEARDPD